MSGSHKMYSADGRQTPSAREQKYFLGKTIAILLCPASNKKVFAVTIDRDDLPRVLQAGPWSVSNTSAARGGFRLYCHSTRRHGGSIVYLHRLVANAPKDPTLEVDHKYGRSLDNRKSELRIVSKSANQRNKRNAGPPNRFGMRGVVATRSGRYAARVFINHRKKHLGTFDTVELAGARVREFLREQGATVALNGAA